MAWRIFRLSSGAYLLFELMARLPMLQELATIDDLQVLVAARRPGASTGEMVWAKSTLAAAAR